MKTKVSLFVFFIGLCCWVGSGFLGGSSSRKLSSSEAKEEEDTVGSVDSSALIEQIETLHSSKAEREARIALDPDAYWDPGRTDSAYRSKVVRHNQISQFLTSSRREDPAYRAVMVKLLENGYGLSDWVDFVGVASQYHMPVSLARNRLEAEGFLGDEIERELVPARAHQSALRRHVVGTCRMVIGISDQRLIDELLEIELPFTPGYQVLGVGPMAMIRGDRLYTDSDWIDEDFLSAAERYTGAKRLERDISQPAMVGQGDVEGVLKQTAF